MARLNRAGHCFLSKTAQFNILLKQAHTDQSSTT